MPTTNQLNQIETLAVGVIHILAGKAQPLWPSTTRAHPSFRVTIHLLPNGALWPDAAALFPMQARWNIWESVVYPVLSDDTNQFFPDNGADRNWGNLALLGDIETLMGKVQTALVVQAQAKGFMAPEAASTAVLAPTNTGEPVDRTPAVDEEAEMYDRHDTDNSPPLYTQFDEGSS